MEGVEYASPARFKLIRRLGQGGAGVVYEAFDRDQETRVAIKFLLPAYAESREVVQRFHREAQAAWTRQGDRSAAARDSPGPWPASSTSSTRAACPTS